MDPSPTSDPAATRTDEQGSGPAGGGAALSRRAFLLLASVFVALHVALIVVACPPRVVFGERPYGVTDYFTHFQQARALAETRAVGRTWTWDPLLLAGTPVGLFFEVDTRGHALFTSALASLGLSEAAAFNLFTPLSGLLAPLALLLAARLLRAGRGAQLVALGLGVALWHFDSGLRYFWASGMISFATAAYGSCLALALFQRVLERPALRFAIPLGLLLGLLVLVHIWSAAILGPPMAVAYLARLRRLPLATHLQVAAAALLALGLNLSWLLPALDQLDLLAPAALLGQANPLYLVADYLGLTRLPLRPDFLFLHTFFRFAALVLAVITLWRWRRARDARFGVSTLALGWLLGLAYLGAFVPGVRATEPYRFIAPAMLLAAVLAGPALAEHLSSRSWRALSPASRVALGVLLVLLAPRPLREVLYFLPELAPPAYVGAGDPTEAGQPRHAPAPPGGPFRLGPVPDGMLEVARFLREECRDEGRILINDWPLAELLRWEIERPILGGFPERRTIHEAANLFRRADDPRLRGRALAEYFERYHVRYVVLGGLPHPHLELRADLLRLKRIVAGYRIHEVRSPSSGFSRGSGRVRARLGRIEVEDATPAAGTRELVLRFHHHRALRCAPRCRLEREDVPHDPAGFIRVVGEPDLPARFAIELGD